MTFGGKIMEKSKVYFTDFRVAVGSSGLTGKLKKLMEMAGIGQIDMDGKFVAFKLHFGELGNLSFLRPNYARAVADMVKDMGGKPYLTDCNTMYPGSRKNALEHLECAWENGFTPLTVGCPILIGDGLKGTDDIAVPVNGGEYIKEAYIGRAIMDADVFLSLTHFKGQEMTGFGGTIKNIGMGCGSRAGKKDQHSSGKPTVIAPLCRGCRRCQRECANNGLEFDAATKKMRVNADNCVGCGRCLGACNFDAIDFVQDNAPDDLNRRMAEYAKAVVDGRPNFHVSLVCDISPNCDCHSENDVPIIPDVGMFASFDPVALDLACADAANAQPCIPGSKLDLARKEGQSGDNLTADFPHTNWRKQITHGKKIGLGEDSYELIKV